jgi:hypothetical protein
MAGKKPAKPMAGQSKQPTLDPAVYGVQVKFLGFKGSGSVCSKCNKETIRGMIRIKQEKDYCSLRCASES